MFWDLECYQGQIISEAIFLGFKSPKQQTIILRIFDLALLNGSNKKCILCITLLRGFDPFWWGRAEILQKFRLHLGKFEAKQNCF